MAPPYVVKRDGTLQALNFDAIPQRLKRLAAGFAMPDGVNVVTIGPPLPEDIAMAVAQKVIAGLVAGVTTRELDEQAAAVAGQICNHPGYATLAARVFVSNLHKGTSPSFSGTFARMAASKRPLVNAERAAFVALHAAELDAMIRHERDYAYDYFALCSLLKQAYLKTDHGTVVERPQYALMREALQDYDTTEEIATAYEALSLRGIGHATPKKHNACSLRAQLASCFLVTVKDDSIEGIYDTVKQTALVSKYEGGVGLSVHPIRGRGSYIKSTDGRSNGIAPMLKVFEATAKYVDQGGGKRKGSFAIYLEVGVARREALTRRVSPGTRTLRTFCPCAT